MKKFLALTVIVLLASASMLQSAKAQVIAPRANYHVLIAGGAADTAHASTTISGTASLLPADYISTYKVQVRIDSLSGTPAGTAKLYFSNDGVNWDVAATTSATWTFITASDTIFNISATSVTAAFAKIAITTTSGTQKIKAKAVLLGAH
jgi:hypothetical protein